MGHLNIISQNGEQDATQPPLASGPLLRKALPISAVRPIVTTPACDVALELTTPFAIPLQCVSASRTTSSSGKIEMHQRVAFYHINKCGGTALLNMFLALCSPDRICRLESFRRSEREGFDHEFMDVAGPAEFIHDPFGSADWNSAFGTMLNILWLREPAARLKSDIKMIARFSDKEVASKPQHASLRDLAREGMAAFLADPSISAHVHRFNAITRFLQLGDARTQAIWSTDHLRESRHLHDLAMEIAIGNLHKMHFIGDVRTFNESLEALLAMLGQPYATRPGVQNEDPDGPNVLTDEEIEMFAPYVHIDQQIYHHAQKMIEARSAPDVVMDQSASTERRYIQGLIGPQIAVIKTAADKGFAANWYFCEQNGSRRSRWTGPGHDSRVAFHVEKTRDLMVRIRVVDVYLSAALNHLRLLAEDHLLSHELYVLPNGNIIIQAPIPYAILRQNDAFLWLTIVAPTAPEKNKTHEQRVLGLCIADIEVAPRDLMNNSCLTRIPINPNG